MGAGAGDFRIRRAEPRDGAAVIALQDAAFPGERGNLDGESLNACLADPKALLLVAEAGGIVVACALARDRPWRPWTSGDSLCVDPRHSGAGIGGALLKTAIGWARRPFFRLFVRPSNARAAALYERTGFVRTGRRRANYVDGEDALILMKPLFSTRLFLRRNGPNP